MRRYIVAGLTAGMVTGPLLSYLGWTIESIINPQQDNILAGWVLGWVIGGVLGWLGISVWGKGVTTADVMSGVVLGLCAAVAALSIYTIDNPPPYSIVTAVGAIGGALTASIRGVFSETFK